MKIKLCFSGWATGFEVERLYEASSGRHVWPLCLGVSEEKILENLRSGFWTVSLITVLEQSDETDITISDIEESN